MQYFKILSVSFSKHLLIATFLLFAFIQAKTQTKQKCFENNGLKYKIVITINFLSSGQVNGTALSMIYDEESTIQKANFTGTINNNILKIKFKETPPIAGAASEWTNRPWVIKKHKGQERLYIVFYSKNYDTRKWSNVSDEFEPCQQQ